MKNIFYDLYRAPLVLWVEDELTRSVLNEVWRNPRISILVGGSKNGVKHLLDATPLPFVSRVLGLVDRDFDDADEASWKDPQRRIFRTSCHEFENLLLDFNLLAEVSRQESAANIRARAQTRAGELLWWMACKATLRQIRVTLETGFPADPKNLSISDLQEALQYINREDFLAKKASHFSQWTPAEVERVLKENEGRFRSDLSSGDWVNTFSGKEIFRYLRSHVRGLDVPRSSEPDLDVGKKIARVMHRQSSVPAPLEKLHTIIKSR